MGYETFIVERSGPIATVYFNRPEKLNPINEKVMREIWAITQELQEDEDSRVVILTGKGRSFCVGADLHMLSAGVDQEKQRQQSDSARLRSAKLGWRIMEEWERLDQITKEFFKALNTNRTGDITYADAHLGLGTFASEDMREAVTAFREKRDGKFRNR